MSHGEKLTIAEQIAHMKKRGISFNVVCEAEAIKYLEANNNYFKLRAYRKNYDKNGNGAYVGLDFAYLKDIAIIDMRLRYTLLKMCLDIEHTARIKVIKAVVDMPDEDGYTVVEDFAAAHEKQYKETLERASKSIYCADLQKKYMNQMPIWALVEMMQFSTLCVFYKFVAIRLNNAEMRRDFYLFQEIRQLRNACAHSNCILNDLKSTHPAAYAPDSEMMRALSAIRVISKDVRRRKMRNDRIRQITTLLYCYKYYVESKGLLDFHTKELREVFFRRFDEHGAFYNNCPPILTTFAFFQKVVDSWYPTAV